MKTSLIIQQKTLTLLPGREDIRIVLHSGGENIPALLKMLPSDRPTIIVIQGMNWNRELSPYPAPGVFRRGEDFAGEGPAYLTRLTGEILPTAEEYWGLSPFPAHRGIAGYSLAGLFALWSLLHSRFFDRAASVSGSLWFDGFAEELENTPFAGQPDRIYLSLGDREKLTRNTRMAAVEDCTIRAEKICRSRGVHTIRESNPGGHFDRPEERLAKGILHLFQGDSTRKPSKSDVTAISRAANTKFFTWLFIPKPTNSGWFTGHCMTKGKSGCARQPCGMRRSAGRITRDRASFIWGKINPE